MNMDLSLFSQPFAPASKRKAQRKTYRVLRNGQCIGTVDAHSPVSVLGALRKQHGEAAPIRRIGCGAVSHINNAHYQAVEI